MKKNDDPTDVALKYLRYRDRSACEIEKHLKEKGFGQAEISDVLTYLTENHIIDDEAFCRHVISHFIKKGKGPLRIKGELEKKGIQSKLIEEALSERFRDGQEFDLATEAIGKLMNKGDMDKKRLARRLESYGFHADVIYRALEHSNF